MTIGYFICVGNKTTCGGEVLEGDDGITWDDLIHAREGDRVSCGKDGNIYRIYGGITHFTSNGRRVAGTLDSVSGCPCKAKLLPSVFTASYENDESPAATAPFSGPARTFTPATHRAAARSDDFVETEIEEEEEEVEQEQLITLRLGVFFDGTGNNQANSESVAGCRARDVNLQEQSEDIRRFCAEHGYGVDGSTPDDSYGNDTSNIARLYELYKDQTDEVLAPEAEEAALKVYLEGIGTVSGGADARYGQATGRWSTGVLARVEQTPGLIANSLRRLKAKSPSVRIKHIAVDVFGFSRGAAAARHFANDVHKGASGLLAKAFPDDSSLLADGFAWQVQRDVTLNFIGLFDTVAGIVSPLVGDFSPGNDRVSGLNLALPANAARKVVQLVARDEHRQNYALTCTDNDIVLPGAHSDIGGGYLLRTRERLLISKPLNSLERLDTPNDRSQAFLQSRHTTDAWINRLIEQGIELKTETWSVDQPYNRSDLYQEKRVYAVAKIDREVDGDLSKVYLRVMRELGLRNRVPFSEIPDASKLTLPPELTPIAEKILAYALGESNNLNLTKAKESLLFRRYIHFSANWNAVKNFKNSDLEVVFINRPSDHYERVLHANK